MTDDLTTLTFDIPKGLWLTSNRHHANRQHRAAIVRDLHHVGASVAVILRMEPITGPVSATWTVQYPKGVRADKGEASNAQPTCKALLDALVPRWLPDDGPRFVVREIYERGPNLDAPSLHRITLTLTPQEDQ